MPKEPTSRSRPTRSKGGEKRDRGDGRSEAQKKADAKYFEAYVVGPLHLFALPISCLSLTVIKR